MHFAETFQYSFSPSMSDIRGGNGNRYKRIPELKEKKNKSYFYKRIDK